MKGSIPPEADITSPRWWAPLPTAGSVPIVGRVAAPRAASYRYEVEFAPGVQPPPWPAQDQWTTVSKSGTRTTPFQGTLATLDMATVRAAIDSAVPPYSVPPFTDPTSPTHPEKDAFRIRVVVCAKGACPADGPALERNPSVAIEQRQYFSAPQPGLVTGFPRYLNADGARSPAFAKLTSAGPNALVVADGNGYLHAFTPSGQELPGWPVHTDPIPLPTTGRNAYTRGLVSKTVYSPVMLGSPAIAPLLGPGNGLDVAVTALDGKLYAWNSAGQQLPGFPVD